MSLLLPILIIISSVFFAIFIYSLLGMYIARKKAQEFACSKSSRLVDLSLCSPKPMIIGEDGSLMESCTECGREWLWVIHNNEPVAIYEADNEFDSFKVLIKLEREELH